LTEKQTRWRPWLLTAAAALILSLLLAGSAWRISRMRCFVLVGAATCRVETPRAMVALTFDDGPTALGVGYILPELERHGAHATFFLIGREARGRPELVRAILAAGHEVGNHSYSHQPMVGRVMTFYENQIQLAQDALRRAGAEPKSFRPPYGKKLIGLPRAVERAGLRLVMWDVEDPKTSDPTEFAREIVSQARPGSIILIHAMYPANETARRALPAVLEGLGRKGLQVVSVEQLVETGKTQP